MSKFVDQMSITDESGNIKKEININFGDPLAREQSQKAMQTSEQAKQTANEAKQIAQEAKDAVPGEVSQQVEEATRELSGQIGEAKQTADEAKEIAENTGVKEGVIQWTNDDAVNKYIIGCNVNSTNIQELSKVSFKITRNTAQGYAVISSYYGGGWIESASVSFNSVTIITVTGQQGNMIWEFVISDAISSSTDFPFGKYFSVNIDVLMPNNIKGAPFLLSSVKEDVEKLKEEDIFSSSERDLLMQLVLGNSEYGLVYKKAGDTQFTLSTNKLIDDQTALQDQSIYIVEKCDCQGVSDISNIFGENKTNNRKDYIIRKLCLYNIAPTGSGMNGLLAGLENLKSVVFLGNTDTSGLTSLSEAFSGLNMNDLQLGSFDMSNVTGYSKMFLNANIGIISFPFNMAQKSYVVTSDMFSDFKGKEINLGFNSNTKMFQCGRMFYNCPNLETVNIDADFSTVSSVDLIFFNTTTLINFSGLYQIKKSYAVQSPVLSHESALNCIERLGPVTTAQTLTFHPDVTAQLTEEEIAEATAKGWNIA